jgi:hypothetical protein
MTDLPFAIISSFVSDAYPNIQGLHKVIWMGLSRITQKLKNKIDYGKNFKKNQG